MKKIAIFSALFSLILPVYVYSLGLGEMKVESALNQPFVAEIQLIDANNTSLSSIKVGLADPQGYHTMGVEPSENMNSLFFEIKKNEYGRYVVAIHSKKRMGEPYFLLVVDLTWPKGQIYKVYTVLLDPPGYKLANTTAQSGLTYHRKFITNYLNTRAHLKNSIGLSKRSGVYGPTVANENIWQIAQRYKATDAMLPQIVLAIVGTNPDAFTEGNLNGLKVGVKLKIPSAQQFLQVPADLATVEVMAHDKAWNEKITINHVLAPPYMIGQVSTESSSVEYSQILPVPKFSSSSIPVLNKNKSTQIPVDLLPSLHTQKQVSPEQSRTFNAEIAITTAVVDTLRDANALLKEQLSLMRAQNNKLQKKLDMQEKELRLMHQQVQTLMKERMALAGQSSSAGQNSSFSMFWLLIILLLVAGGSGGAAFYYFKRHHEGKNRVPKTNNNPNNTDPHSTLHSITDVKQGLKNQTPLLMSQAGFDVKPKPAPTVKPEAEVKLEPSVKLELESSNYIEKNRDIETHENSKESVTALSIDLPTLETNESLLEVSKVIDETEIQEKANKNNSSTDELHKENLLEFESGLHRVIAEKPKQNDNHSEELAHDNENGLDFIPSKPVEDMQKPTEQENTALSTLKNTKALGTLLALARTYLGMEDKESAIHSLKEVIEHGNKKQREEAQHLLDEINGKSSSPRKR